MNLGHLRVPKANDARPRSQSKGEIMPNAINGAVFSGRKGRAFRRKVGGRTAEHGMPKQRTLRAAGNDAYVTHAELLKLARRNRCLGIQTEPVLTLCRPKSS